MGATRKETFPHWLIVKGQERRRDAVPPSPPPQHSYILTKLHWARAQAQAQRSHWPSTKGLRRRRRHGHPIGRGQRERRGHVQEPGAARAKWRRSHVASRGQANGLLLEEGGWPQGDDWAAGARASGRCLVGWGRGLVGPRRAGRSWDARGPFRHWELH